MVVWWWFWANMAGLRNIRNTNAFKFILQVFILSQKHGERTKAHWDKSPLGQKPTGQYPTGQKPTA